MGVKSITTEKKFEELEDGTWSWECTGQLKGTDGWMFTGDIYYKGGIVINVTQSGKGGPNEYNVIRHNKGAFTERKDLVFSALIEAYMEAIKVDVSEPEDSWLYWFECHRPKGQTFAEYMIVLQKSDMS